MAWTVGSHSDGDRRREEVQHRHFDRERLARHCTSDAVKECIEIDGLAVPAKEMLMRQINVKELINDDA
ncbi:hypothetical protein NDU88_000722 [Pleurodeles waltl]|uniref:Uncharacterized protein n=1 Tax=Pleurodeles waltl TaxID=8319 RepID=A0AAV7SXI2_PLEWA|nr:hypothetical protein NDU88_000722 [Pleurodeles waltl]